MSLRFATALFVSAMLLFTCQPLVARMIVPLLGGAPAVWIVCSLAFQALLLAGYGYAHFVGTRFAVRTQVVLQIVLVLSVFLVLPVAVDEQVAERLTRDHPTVGLLLLLLRTIGLPFFVLSTTSPLIQRWFAELGETDPYYLYAASNAGSMIALLGYPFIVEPNLAVGAQSRALHVGYAAYTLLLAVCAVTTFTRRHPKAVEAALTPVPPEVASEVDLTGASATSLAPGERPTLLATPQTPYGRMSQRLTWIALAFAPSSLLLGVTEYVTTDVASVPLLWVVPLAIYLATFIVAFSKRQPIAESTWARLLALTAALVVALMITQRSRPTWVVAGLHLALLFLGAVVCHRALARLRPRVSRLTEFYLLLSVGGVLGGVFNGIIAPAIFDDLFEYPLAIGLVCLGRVVLDPDPDSTPTHIRRDVLFAGVASLVLLLASRLSQRFALPWVVLAAVPLVALVVAFTWSTRHPVRYAVLLVGIAFAGTRSVGGEVIFEDRSFFGVLKVRNEPSKNVRTLVYGRTVHGMESLDPAQAMTPLSYYTESGPAGDVLGPLPKSKDEKGGRSVGVIGLGIGSLASYARAGDTWTFFEINPMVATIAKKYFDYLPLAEARSTIDVEIGDARLRLRSGAPHRFDVLVLDAFSSDAIPVHLVTRQALAVYRRALKPNGVLLAHISNKHVDLKPVFAALAKDTGMLARVRRDEDVSKALEEAGKAGSVWILLTESVDEMMRISVEQPAWTPIVAPESQKVWTDDFANVLGAMR